MDYVLYYWQHISNTEGFMNRISEFRKAANLTQTELGLLINRSQGAIGHIETGRRQVSMDTAKRIVKAFNSRGISCSLDDVFPIGK